MRADTPGKIAMPVDVDGEMSPGKVAERSALGLRARNRLSKEAAIRKAATRLFLEKGYEATTLREVAEAADVGFGTVFNYANDKAGLLAMVFVNQLRGIPPLGSTTARRASAGALRGFQTSLRGLVGDALAQRPDAAANGVLRRQPAHGTHCHAAAGNP